MNSGGISGQKVSQREISLQRDTFSAGGTVLTKKCGNSSADEESSERIVWERTSTSEESFHALCPLSCQVHQQASPASTLTSYFLDPLHLPLHLGCHKRQLASFSSTCTNSSLQIKKFATFSEDFSIIPRLLPEAWGWILEVDVGLEVPVQQPSWPEYSPWYSGPF